ncbi:hypothetical protein [Vampirovibrio chlorellavorus]|uniref:hypothetical protein n=1 Tax=Vampirovibrio chlorellavorus TaxID=758823 RepID=UPI0026EC15FE|nr:hypothetical protein [Vampirovibrio chlorellavorus]
MVTFTPGLNGLYPATALNPGLPSAWKQATGVSPLAVSAIAGAGQTPKAQSPVLNAHVSHQNSTLLHVGKGAALITGALLLKKLPARTVSHFRLFSTDWKEWAKVLLAIGGLGEAQKAIHWKPPVWLSAMFNVAVVTPLVTKLNLQNVLHGVILSPLVGGLAGLNHYLGEKAEQPAQTYLHLPATATRILLSALTTLTGLAILPAVGKAIPLPAKSWPGQSTAQATAASDTAARAGAGTICANGCCASLICANEAVQMGSAMLGSHQARQHDRKTQP